MFFILSLLESTALFGFFSLIVSTILVHKNLFEMIEIALHPDSFKEIFISYMIWSLPAYVILLLIHVLLIILTNKIQKDNVPVSAERLFRIFLINLTNPFKGLFSLIVGKKVIDSHGSEAFFLWFQVILHFVWSVLLILWIGIGFIIMLI